MPGINSSNVKFLMNRVESLYELSTLSLDRLKVRSVAFCLRMGPDGGTFFGMDALCEKGCCGLWV